VEPVDGGEYDIDLAAICASRLDSPNKALGDLEKAFRGDGRFASRVKLKKPCIRLEYAPDDVGKFHVDVVPTRWSVMHRSPLEVPRRNEDWHGTAPAEYTQWCLAQGEQYARTVKALKRWRDDQQSVRTAIKSIVLQVLVSEHMPRSGDDASRITQTIESMTASLESLSRPPAVWNPVLPDEDLAVRWTPQSFANFVRELKEAREWLRQANKTDDLVECIEAWREVLGEDFPASPPNRLGLLLGDTSHEQGFAARNWRQAIDPTYSIRVSATQQRGKRGPNLRRYASGGPPVFAGHKLRFKADVRAPYSAEVWWQVTNTGAHAQNQRSLRGKFLKAKSINDAPSKDETEHWESTAYTGTHRVRAVLVRQNTVVAVSDWIEVNIWSPNWRTAWGQ